VFLDRLAEILCREKNSPFIASTGMVEAEDKVTIFAARNGARWTDRDVQLMEELATVMESLSLKGSVVIPSRFFCLLLTAPIGTYDEGSVSRLQGKLAEYYSLKLRFHTKELPKHEGGKTRMPFFTDECRRFFSGATTADDFVSMVEKVRN
jgi:hypothetical protein